MFCFLMCVFCMYNSAEWQQTLFVVVRTKYLEILKYHTKEQLTLFPLLDLNSKNCFSQDILRVHSAWQWHTLNTTALIKKINCYSQRVSVILSWNFLRRSLTSRDRLTTLFSKVSQLWGISILSLATCLFVASLFISCVVLKDFKCSILSC